MRHILFYSVMKNIIIISSIVFFITVKSQVRFVNEFGRPISSVKCLSKKGLILSVSDIKGEINLAIIQKEFDPKEKDSIEIVHPDFEDKKITWDYLNISKEINLNSIKNIMPVTIMVNSNRILKLRAYFTSYQLIDNTPQSFSDGIIEYYISLSDKKLINYNIIENRVFKNTYFIEELSKKKGRTTLNIGNSITPFDFNEELLLNDWHKFKIENSKVIILKNQNIGNINVGDNQSDIYIEFYAPKRTRENSLLGMKSLIENYNILESFSSKDYNSISKLNHLSKYYKSSITQNKVTMKYELMQNLKIIDVKTLSKEDFKSLKISYNHSNSGSIYKTDYWMGQEIPQYIQQSLNNQFKLIIK